MQQKLCRSKETARHGDIACVLTSQRRTAGFHVSNVYKKQAPKIPRTTYSHAAREDGMGYCISLPSQLRLLELRELPVQLGPGQISLVYECCLLLVDSHDSEKIFSVSSMLNLICTEWATKNRPLYYSV